MMITTMTDELEDRLLRAVHDADDPNSDLEGLAHEVAASDAAQAYLVELVQTLSALSAASPPARRAAALLEHGLAVAAEHGTDAAELAQHATATQTRESDG